MPNVPYPYEVNWQLVAENGSLTPVCALSKRSLSPSLNQFSKCDFGIYWRKKSLSKYCRCSIQNVTISKLWIRNWWKCAMNHSCFNTTIFFCSKNSHSSNMPHAFFHSRIRGDKIATKGHLISEWNFGVFKSPKKPTKFFPGFLP